MTSESDTGTPTNEAAHQAVRWAHVLCVAPSMSPADVAASIGTDLTGSEQLGSGIVCTPPDGADSLQLVIGRDHERVQFIEYEPSGAVTVEDLEEFLGPGREAPLGPHEISATIIFDDVGPDDAERGCTVMARLAADPYDTHAVAHVTLYVQSE